jgi:hypothetical protein
LTVPDGKSWRSTGDVEPLGERLREAVNPCVASALLFREPAMASNSARLVR